MKQILLIGKKNSPQSYKIIVWSIYSLIVTQVLNLKLPSHLVIWLSEKNNQKNAKLKWNLKKTKVQKTDFISQRYNYRFIGICSLIHNKISI